MTNDNQNTMAPEQRLRRLRHKPALREMLRENSVKGNDLIYPMFICDGVDQKTEISSMPGQYRFSLDLFSDEVGRLAEKGVRSILLFGVPDDKDEKGTGAYCDNGLIQKAISICKEVAPQLICVSDVCLCEFTSHGHCGLIHEGEVQNDESLELLAQMALSHAQSGADMVAPSAMMDYQIEAIRSTLDSNGYRELPIMGYSAKFSSGFYGPFREAANSAPQFGDRKSYQMDPMNSREAMREIKGDLEQGADIIMVKPALSYMDIVRQARDLCDNPIAVYNVSGEYAMIKAAAEKGWIDEKAVTLEMLGSFKRAGADIIISYHTPQVIDWLQEK